MEKQQVIPATSTVVELQCISKKHGHQYGHSGNPLEHEIELAVPYDTTSVFYKQSGGTNFTLKTINGEAAAMFEVGGTYRMTLEPVQQLEPVQKEEAVK